MIDVEGLDVSTLEQLYRHIGSLICEKTDHDWTRVKTTSEHHMNTPNVDRCKRCGRRRVAQSWSTTTRSTSTISISESDSDA